MNICHMICSGLQVGLDRQTSVTAHLLLCCRLRVVCRNMCAAGMEESRGIVIRGGTVVNENCSVLSDIYIENGQIVEVGLNLHIPEGVRVIDATDKLVMPGGIDTHTHMELAFMGTKAVDDFHVGTKVKMFCSYKIKTS